MHAISVAGLLCVDLRPDLDESARLAPGRLLEIGSLAMGLGGVIGNTGVDLLDLGVPVRLACGVGDDELGAFARTTLADLGADVSGVDVIAGQSTSYSLILEPRGVDRTIWHNVGANAVFDGRAVDLDGIDLLHLGYPPLLPALVVDGDDRLIDLLVRTQEAGVTASVDLAYVDAASTAATADWSAILPRMVAHTDVLSPSLDDVTSALRIDEDFSPELVDRVLTMFLDWGVAVIALSAGTHGMYLRTAGRDRLSTAGRALSGVCDAWADQDLHVPPVWTSTPVTTNGAGDATSAGLLLGIANGCGPQSSARLAAACSGVIVSGGRTTVDAVVALCPDLADVLSGGPS